jgi:hypothetical protein
MHVTTCERLLPAPLFKEGILKGGIKSLKTDVVSCFAKLVFPTDEVLLHIKSLRSFAVSAMMAEIF